MFPKLYATLTESLTRLLYCMFSSGAEYAYFMEAFGPFFAYMFSWVSTMIIKPSQVKTLSCSHGKISCGFLHRKKRLATFPSPDGMPLTKHSLGGSSFLLQCVHIRVNPHEVCTYTVKKGLPFSRPQPERHLPKFGKWRPGWGRENRLYLQCITRRTSLFILLAVANWRVRRGATDLHRFEPGTY